MQERVAEKTLESRIEAQTGAKTKIDLANKSITIKAKEGALTFTAEGGVKVPEDFPKDVYLEKNSKVNGILNAGGTTTIGIETPKELAEITKNYKDGMKVKGWHLDSENSLPGISNLVFKKNERIANIMLFGSGDKKTQVNISIQSK